MKKWFCILLALGLSFTNVYADDDWEDWEEEEAAPAKKAAPKKAAKKTSSSDSPSRIGLYTSFGAHSPIIGIAYDMGNGIQLGAGVMLDRESATAPSADPVVNQTFAIEPIITYELGKSLLNYGVGLRAFYASSTDGDADPVTKMGAVPNIYVSAALVPNIALSLNAGLGITMLGENKASNLESGMNLETITSLMIVFYFM